MNAQDILDDQKIVLKRGRTNNYGFEPAANSYFDFYLSPKYLEPPLLKLEDISFHLFLRKNLNDKNPRWKMPTIRQMIRLLGISQRKITSIMERLDNAQLLKKESGVRKGARNDRNSYILFDPILTLDEFLFVAGAGFFGQPLKPEWALCMRDAYITDFDVRASDTPYVCVEHTDQQTFTSKQTGDLELEKLWNSTIKSLEPNIPSATFHTFLQDLRLMSFEDGAVVLGTSRPWVQQWVEVQMRNRIRQALELELRMVNDPRKVDTIRCTVVAEE